MNSPLNSPLNSPFRSARGVSARRRLRPAVERSTFVVAEAGDLLVALPVEQVERVVRASRGAAEVAYGAWTLPVLALAERLGRASALTGGDEQRILVLPAPQGSAAPVALAVDAVREVYAVETDAIAPAVGTADTVAGDGDAPGAPPSHPAVRGRFSRRAHTVWIIEASRLGGHA